MLVCPACQTENMAGSMFCSDCGASFLPSTMGETTASLGAAVRTGEFNAPPVARVAPPVALSPTIRVVILNSGRKLGFNTNQPIVIGRQDAKGTFYPDIDLSTDGGLEAGVSRRHATILIENGNYLIEDLNSSNGTFVNRQRVVAGNRQRLQHGDEVRLGNILIRVELNS